MLILAIYERAWFNIFLILFTFVITYSHIPLQKYNIMLPREFQVFIIMFIGFSLILGEIWNFYIRFPWWDTLLHWFSGLALWIVGFLIMYVFYKTWKFSAPIILIPIFSFSFALCIWALWEIFEYSADSLLWKNMQKARNLELIYWYFDTRLWVLDTMHDLIVDSVWALIASFYWYVYLKKWDSTRWFTYLVNSFEKVNKKLFHIPNNK